MIRIVLALILLVLLLAGPEVHSAQPPVPFTPGDTWVYRNTRTVGTKTQYGSLTVIYRGTGQYRGDMYHYDDSYSSFSSGSVEREIQIWTGRYFRVRATVLYQNGQPVLEMIFDRPYALSGVQEEFAGMTEVYERGLYASKSLWAIDVAWRGTGKVSVPAGTFTAEKWSGILRIGRMTHAYLVYTVGPHAVRAEIDVTRDGEPLYKTLLELQQGPAPAR